MTFNILLHVGGVEWKRIKDDSLLLNNFNFSSACCVTEFLNQLPIVTLILF